MSATVASPRPSATGIVFSLVMVCLAGALVFQSVQLFRYSAVSVEASTLLGGEYWKRPLHSQLEPMRERVAEWRDEPGVRKGARQLYMKLGQVWGASADTMMADAADVIRIDPVSSRAWADFAMASLAATRLDLAFAAWDISAVVAPREDEALLWRLSFLAGLWNEASEERRQRFLFDLQILSTRGAATQFPKVWPRILASLPPDLAKELETARWRQPRPSE